MELLFVIVPFFITFLLMATFGGLWKRTNELLERIATQLEKDSEKTAKGGLNGLE